MKIIHRYIFFKLIRSFLLTFTVLTLIIFIISMWQIMRHYGQFVQLTTLLSAAPFIVGKAISFTLPMSFLPAVTSTYGSMSHENEILILRTSGMSLFSYLAPAIVIGILSSLFSLYINCEIIPWMNQRRDSLTRYAFDLLVSASFKSGQNTIDFIPKTKIRYQYLENGKFYKLFIQRIGEKKEEKKVTFQVTQEVVAERGSLLFDSTNRILNFQLENVTIVTIKRGKKFGEKLEEEKIYFDSFSFPINIGRSDRLVIERAKYKGIARLMKDTREMRDEIKRLLAQQKIPKKYNKRISIYRKYYKSLVEIHERFATAFTPLVIILIGAPLGILIRHSNRLVAFGISAVPIFLIYYPAMMIGKALAEKASIHAFWGMWTCNFLMIILGFVLIRHVSRQ